MLTKNDLVKTENTFATVIDTLQNKDDLVDQSFWKTLEAHRELIKNDKLIMDNPRVKITFYVYYSISRNKLVAVNVAGDSVFRTGIQVDDSTAIGRAMLDQNHNKALELIRKKVLASAKRNQAKLNKLLLADDNSRQLASMIKRGLVPVELDDVWMVLKKDYCGNQDLLNSYLTLATTQKNTQHWDELFPFVILNGAETNQGRFNLIQFYTMIVHKLGADEVVTKMLDCIDYLIKMSNTEYLKISNVTGYYFNLYDGLQVFDTVVTNCPELKDYPELFKAFGKLILRDKMTVWCQNNEDNQFNNFDEFIDYIKDDDHTNLTIGYDIVPPMKNNEISEWIFVEFNELLFS